ncbi:MAG TPA: PspC domain-containing protein, partial [Thermoanaerobaculia bacterium]|nr:PspC domain-containing protein [Thermoanaerobaculia bacterium]
AVAGAFVAVPLVVFFVMRAILRDRHGNRICKRLKPGKQISGVCLGLSEATGVPVLLFRLGFVVLLFVNGIGLWLYILLDLAMPVHPDDRQHLLRFKLRRMWQRRTAHADHDAG